MEYRQKHILASSRHELVVGIAALFLVGGIGGLVPGLAPRTVVELVPHWTGLLWLWCLILGGGGLLLSVFLPDRVTALRLEWPAYLFIGVGALVYGAALLSRWQGTTWLAEVTYLILGSACVWRAVHVLVRLRSARA